MVPHQWRVQVDACFVVCDVYIWTKRCCLPLQLSKCACPYPFLSWENVHPWWRHVNSAIITQPKIWDQHLEENCAWNEYLSLFHFVKSVKAQAISKLEKSHIQVKIVIPKYISESLEIIPLNFEASQYFCWNYKNFHIVYFTLPTNMCDTESSD